MAQAGAGNRAQELLKRIHALYREGYYEVSPDIVSYNSVLKAWKEEERPEAALELLETMIRNEREAERKDSLSSSSSSSETTSNDGINSNSSSDKTIRVDVISFNTVMAAFANQGNYNKALELLRKMQNVPKQGAENLLREMMMRKERTGLSVVDTMSFNTVLYAWSREGEKKHAPVGVGVKATGTSSKSFGTTTRGPASSRPTSSSSSSSSSIRKRPVSPKMAAQRAEDLLTIMAELSEAGNLSVRPDVYSYTTVIQAWAKCGGAAGTDKAKAILDQMVDRGLQPNQMTYTALMSALGRAGEPERAESVLRKMARDSPHAPPDAVAVSSIIHGWARVSSKDRPEAAERALQILRTMKQKQHDDPNMRPTATTYTSVLTALAKSGTRDACDQALELLQEMEEAHAKQQQQQQQQQQQTTTTAAANKPAASEPNQQSYKYHLDPRKKESKWSVRPKNIHYNCVLDAYARSSRADKAIKAQNLMTVMENHSRLDCRPDTISYNSLMMACAHATGNQELREQSFEIAFRTFKILLVSKGGGNTSTNTNGFQNPERLSPNQNHNNNQQKKKKPVHDLYPTSATFAHFFRACRKLLRPDNPRRKPILTKSLTICRKLGLLNFLVVHQVQLACPSERAWRDIAGELADHVGWKEDFKRCGHRVPHEWTCNARR
eukprot:jgi/Psemu1/290404/fgenesh1_pg.492_\